MPTWTEREIDYIKNNYQIMKPKELSIALGRTNSSIYHFLSKNKLISRKVNRKHDNINIERFQRINEPVIAYFLGFLWADGHISKKSYSVNFTIMDTDSVEIEKALKFAKLEYRSKVSRYSSHKNNKINNLKIVNKELHSLLIDLDYQVKSTGISPDKVLSKLSDNLKNFFILGYFDGDGCFFRSKNQRIAQFTSAINQDWNFLINRCKAFNIKYRITRPIRNEGKSNGSNLRLESYLSIINFFNDIYKDININNFGFKRKYEKYLLIVNDCIFFLNDRKNGIERAIVKTGESYKVLAIANKNTILIRKRYRDPLQGIAAKIETIEKFQTEEFKLRTLTNYWEFTI